MRVYILLAITATLLLGCVPRPNNKPSIEFVSLPTGWIQPQVEYVNNIFHVLFFMGDPGAGNLYYTTFDLNTKEFKEPERVNQTDSAAVAAGTIRGGQMAVEKDGTVHVLWNGSGKSVITPNDSVINFPLLYTRKLAGKDFEKERNLIENAWGLDGGSDLAVDDHGKVFVAWHGRGELPGEIHRRVYMRISNDSGGNFGTEKAINAPEAGVCGCCGLHINVNQEKKPVVIYRSAKERKHRDIHMISIKPSGEMALDTIIDQWELEACPMSSIQSSVASEDYLITWEKEGKVYFKEQSNPEILFPQTQSNGAKHSKIAQTNSGYTLIIWTEGTGWNKGGHLAWELTGSDNLLIETGKKEGAIPVWSFPAVIYAGNDRFLVFN